MKRKRTDAYGRRWKKTKSCEEKETLSWSSSLREKAQSSEWRVGGRGRRKSTKYKTGKEIYEGEGRSASVRDRVVKELVLKACLARSRKPIVRRMAVWKGQNAVWFMGAAGHGGGGSRNGVACRWHIWDAREDLPPGSGHLRDAAACPIEPHHHITTTHLPHSLVYWGLRSPVGLCEVREKRKDFDFSFLKFLFLSSSPLFE